MRKLRVREVRARALGHTVCTLTRSPDVRPSAFPSGSCESPLAPVPSKLARAPHVITITVGLA